MKIRTKLAATALAAGSIIAGGAALSMSSAEAAPPVVKAPGVTLNTLPPFTIVTIKPNICILHPELCPKPSTTQTTTKQETTTSTKYTSTTKYTPTTQYHEPADQPTYDPPVKATPAFTG